MKIYAWNSEKNELLKENRGVSFEEVVLSIQLGNEVDDEIFLKTIIPSRKATKKYIGWGY